MKKNIEIIYSDYPFLCWLLEKLKDAPPDLLSAKEMLNGVKNLMDGISSSIMVEVGNKSNDNIHKNIIEYKNLKIYINSRTVTRDDEEIYLTPKEFDILYFLAKNKGEIFTKEQIYKAVWKNDYLLDDSNIMAFIRKLRKKIEPDPDSPRYILTIWGIGYKFNDK